MCVCVYIYLYIYIYVCVRVCVHVVIAGIISSIDISINKTNRNTVVCTKVNDTLKNNRIIQMKNAFVSRHVCI